MRTSGGSIAKESIDASRERARVAARSATGVDAVAAHGRVQAITEGRGPGLLVDPADAAVAARAWEFMDAASNAVLAAGLRPHLPTEDFEYLWRPYDAILGSAIAAKIRVASASGAGAPDPAATRNSATPVTFEEELAQASMPPRPDWVVDPRIDDDLRGFVHDLLGATWGDWQVVHHRLAAIPRPITIHEELRQNVGDEAAAAAADYANATAVLVNRVVLDSYVRQASIATDPRLTKTWLEILDDHDGPPTGALFQAVWAIVLRRGLSSQARAQSGQPYSRCGDPAKFGLAPID